MFADRILIQAAGRDVGTFLQGQLTCDIQAIQRSGEWCLSGYCNPEGRVLTLLWVFPWQDSFLLAVAGDSAADFRARIGRYILRSDVAFHDTDLYLTAVAGESPDTGRTLHHDGGKCCLGGVAGIRPCISTTPGDEAGNTALDIACIRAGIADINRDNSARFLPQMLNLAAFAGISLNKGCYLGQEGIARAQYKTRLHRLLAYAEMPATAPAPAPATALIAENGATAGIVLRSADNDKHRLIQAVIHSRCLNQALTVAGNPQPLIFCAYH